MRKLYSFWWMLLFSLSGLAQSFYYSPVAHLPKYFSDGKEVYILKATSKTSLNGMDTYEIMKQPLEWCSKDTVSWISQVRSQNHVGSTITDDYQNFQFKIDGLTFSSSINGKGSKGVAMTFSDGNQVEYEVKDIAWETFLGLSDSVKTISFSLKNPSSKPEQKVYDSLYYKLSKNYGLIETRLLEIRQEKGRLYERPGEVGKKVWLVGIEKQKLGWKFLTDSAAYNFEIGDEFHISGYSKGSHSQPIHGMDFTTKTIKRVLSKKIKNDSVSYEIARQYEKQPTFPPASPPTYKEDTIVERYSYSSKVLDINRQYFLREDDENNPWLGPLTQYVFNFEEGDSVLNVYDGSGCPLTYGGSTRRMEGLGTPEWEAYNGLGGNSYEKLVYYRKGERTWGTKLILGEEKESGNEESMIISPNPASGHVTLFLGKQGQFQLYSQEGAEKVVLKNLNLGEHKLDLHPLPAGLYHYKITFYDNSYKSGKLVVY